MNWGKGITLFIICFIATMLGMVYIAFKQSNEMIEDNYYDREVKYQKIIDAKSNLRPLLNDFELKDTFQFIWLKLPLAAARKIENGELRMIKMDRADADQTIPIEQPETHIDKSKFQKGIYHIKLSWTSENIPYFYETDLAIR